jgi:prepilin-type N-terminal cleavage/methylation domain-containing protein
MRRPAMTLMEVLIAIFVMGIGLLGVMALFPLGAASMARAIKDDRAGHAAANARAIAIAMNVPFDPIVTKQFNPAFPPDGPSNPVFADPLGFLSYSIASKSTIAGVKGNAGIPRCVVSFVQTPNLFGVKGATAQQAAMKWCSLMDDITFGFDGTPYLTNGFVDRGGNFSWAWMLQRPKAGNASCCNMSVVVYNQRPLSGAGLLSGKEVAYLSYVDPVSSTLGETTKYTLVSLTWNPKGGTPKPQLAAGNWVLDMTPDANNVPVGTFHRVVNVGDIAVYQPKPALLSMPLELGQPLRTIMAPVGPTKKVFPTLNRNLVTMDGVSEVLDCGPGWKSWSN